MKLVIKYRFYKFNETGTTFSSSLLDSSEFPTHEQRTFSTPNLTVSCPNFELETNDSLYCRYLSLRSLSGTPRKGIKLPEGS